MDFVKCDEKHFEETVDLYKRVVTTLRATVNYPKWGVHHPSEEDLANAFENGEMYITIDDGAVTGATDGATDGAVTGAVVLSEDPEGYYEAGDWKVDLDRGEFLCIHLLATDPLLRNKGIGGFIVDRCIETAEQGGYKALRLDAVPTNYPAIHLYEGKGFTFAGLKDLKRDVKAIPLFALYEYNI